MAPKKDFSGIGTGRVYGSIETATSKKGQQGTASPQEIEARKEALRTQGRKGAKATRINMAFTPGNYDFIRIAARASGHTMTEFTNIVIEKYRAEHPEIMEQANILIDIVNGSFSTETTKEPDADTGDDAGKE